MLMTLSWTRIVVAGRPQTYSAGDGGRMVGRIQRRQSGGWFWTMNAVGPDIEVGSWICSGNVETKDVAERMVEMAYEACRSR
jgi:hypothetical protein